MLRIAATAAVGVLVLEVLRTHVGQRYLIPSRSMEPTLHGDPERGDIVLVDKLGWLRPHARTALARFDMVVLRDGPNGQSPLVKRVVSLGDELLRILDGDLFTRPLSGGPWQRIAKDPLSHRDLRFTFFECGVGVPAVEPVDHYLSRGPAADGAIGLVAAGLDAEPVVQALAHSAPVAEDGTVLATRVPIDVSFVDALGRRSAATERCSDDIGIELDVDLGERCAGLCLGLVLRGQAFVLVYESGGALAWRGTSSAGPLRAPPLGGPVSVAFGYLDGRLFLEVNGRLAALLPQDLPGNAELAQRNAIRVAVLGRGERACARIVRLRLFHDVYYQAENQPWVGLREYKIEPDEVFLLGDNTFDSVDSRARGPFAAADIVGRPLAVIGPLQRVRWLAR